MNSEPYHTLIIGAGLAGLTAACHIARAGKRTLLVAEGIGAVALTTGCVDVLGFHPPDSRTPVARPLDALSGFLSAHPDHPYHRLGVAGVEAGLRAFARLAQEAGLDYRGDLRRNWLLPSPAGAVRPTALAPASMATGDLTRRGRILVVGFTELRDFYPALLCDTLNAQRLGVRAAPFVLDAPPPAGGRFDITPLQLAEAFERADFRRAVVRQVKPAARGFGRVAFPAVLGLTRHAEVWADLQAQLGKPVVEIPTLPPSAPGRRLFEGLKRVFLSAGGRFLLGSRVLEGEIAGGRVTGVRLQTAARPKILRAENYVLATGGLFGGGVETDAEGRIWEPIFGLPLAEVGGREGWFAPEFLAPGGHPIERAGVQVNDRLNPIAPSGEVIAGNLFVVGTQLAGTNGLRGRTGEGVAVASAARVAQIVNRQSSIVNRQS